MSLNNPPTSESNPDLQAFFEANKSRESTERLRRKESLFNQLKHKLWKHIDEIPEQERLMMQKLLQYLEYESLAVYELYRDHKLELLKKTNQNIAGYDRILEDTYIETITYFMEPEEGKSDITPLQHIARILTELQEPQELGKKADFNQAQELYARKLIRNIFWQHLDNPLEYSSHGCDHTLAVVRNDDVKWKTNNERYADYLHQKYHLEPDQAVFITRHIALFHDCGYAHLHGKTKSAHPLESLKKVRKIHETGIMEDLLPNLTPAQLIDLIEEVEFTILYHGADVFEKKYLAKLCSNRRSILLEDLAYLDKIVPQTNENCLPITSVEVQSEADRERILEKFSQMDPEILQNNCLDIAKIQEETFISIKNVFYGGRSIDWKEGGDKLAGLEQQKSDFYGKHPLLAGLIHADNDDSSNLRLNEAQKHPLTMGFCQLMGDDRPLSKCFQRMEEIREQYHELKNKSQAEDTPYYLEKCMIDMQEVVEKLMKTMKEFYPSFELPITIINDIAKHIDPDVFELRAREVIFRYLLENSPEVDEKLLLKIEHICLTTPLETYWHWAGLNAVDSIELKENTKVITINENELHKYSEPRIEKNVKHMEEDGTVIETIYSMRPSESQVFRIWRAHQNATIDGKVLPIKTIVKRERDGETVEEEIPMSFMPAE